MSRRAKAGWFRPTIKHLLLLSAAAVLCVVYLFDVWNALAIGLVMSLSLLLFGVAASSLALRTYAWRTPSGLDEIGYHEPTEPELGFSLIVPARDEVAVLPRTLGALAALNHPRVQIVVVVSGDDDDETREVAYEAAFRDGRIRVVRVYGAKNKPRALNDALRHCRYNIIGIMDAESIVAADLLLHVDSRFRETGADVIQSGVQLMNFQSSWYALQNCLEYFFWFRSRLHFHAAQGFIPLGGNTVFMKRQWLDEVGGWDGDCLAEDCEIGVRMSVAGARTVVAYEPALITREETPGDLPALLNQRVRWVQGYFQTLRKGVWRQLPTLRERMLARYTLLMPFVQAFAGVLVPLSIVSALWLKLPAGVALFSFLPLLPALGAMAVDTVGMSEFAQMYGLKPRVRDYVKLVLGTFPYHFILSVAAAKAVLRDRRGITNWYKTAHSGVHHLEAVGAEK